MGENEWDSADSWPLLDTKWTNFYLHSGGHANTQKGDGKLDLIPPAVESEDLFLYDPRNPVPTIGGQLLAFEQNIMGPVDESKLEERADILCYTSSILTDPVKVVGPAKAKLFISSSAKDTDFTVRLHDVYPDGRSIIVCEGIQCVRYRNSLEKTELMNPGTIYEIEVDIWDTAISFQPGHRIRVDISSSNFPHFEPNTNTGGNMAEETLDDAVLAINRIHHSEQYPSHIILPIVK